jgi:UrcA family protein
MYIQHCSNLAHPASNLSKSRRKAVICALFALAWAIAALTPATGHADEFSPRSIHVSIAGLDPHSVKGAHQIYARLEQAAWIACGESTLDIQVLATGGPSKCVQEALAHAVREVRSVELSQLYLKRHGSKLAAEYRVTPEILTAQK